MPTRVFMPRQSFREVHAAADLVFCDFGLMPAQRRFLENPRRVATVPSLTKEHIDRGIDPPSAKATAIPVSAKQNDTWDRH